MFDILHSVKQQNRSHCSCHKQMMQDVLLHMLHDALMMQEFCCIWFAIVVCCHLSKSRLHSFKAMSYLIHSSSSEDAPSESYASSEDDMMDLFQRQCQGKGKGSKQKQVKKLNGKALQVKKLNGKALAKNKSKKVIDKDKKVLTENGGQKPMKEQTLPTQGF